MSGQNRYTDVLVPTDGSEAAETAVDHAIAVAADNDATVHTVYVVDIRVTMAAEDGIRDELAEDLREEGDAAVERIADRAAEAGIPTEHHVLRGTPWKKILEYTEDAGIDLIVIGTAGKSPREKRMRLGSVSERVVDDATVPVLVIPDRE